MRVFDATESTVAYDQAYHVLQRFRPQRGGDGALVHDINHALVFTTADPRWVGTGRTVFDNKGNPVKQYEPFFSGSPGYEDETELAEWGVTPILRYDPLGRLVRTDLPNGTFNDPRTGPRSGFRRGKGEPL